MADRGGNAEFGARVCGCQLFFLNTMAISRQAKEETLGELREKLQRSKGLIFTNYQGLTVKDVTELRNTLRKNDVELVVSKKTLMR
jgi:large subunit ribosomal protein L10